MKTGLLGVLFIGLWTRCLAAEPWQTIVSNDSVTIEVENVLYEKTDGDKCFIHVKLINQSENEIGVDLNDPWSVIYPNQWGASASTSRGVIDELRRFMPFDSAFIQKTIEAFKSKSLTLIKGKGSTDYYIAFNADGKKKLKDVREKYVLVVVDGSIVFTDGKNVRQVSLEKVYREREVVMPTPLEWKLLPVGSLIVG